METLNNILITIVGYKQEKLELEKTLKLYLSQGFNESEIQRKIKEINQRIGLLKYAFKITSSEILETI